MPRHLSTEGPTVNKPLPPEVLLAGAVLRQAIHDALGKRLVHDSVSAGAKIQADAQAFLRNPAEVGFWCAMVGADLEQVAPALWRAAGMAEGRGGHDATQETR